MFAMCPLALIFALGSLPVAAGDILLSNNSGSDNAVFFVEGESTLVMNGFDLTPLGLPLPLVLDAVSISVATPVAGGIPMVLYQDANGGSPVDAQLLHQESVSLARPGLNRLLLSQPVVIEQPVLWVGFYLPVGFEFHADTSGASVLTYWAWTPGGIFDLSDLSSAVVLGPGDGSAPVDIAMDGIARITAEISGSQAVEYSDSPPIGQQIQSSLSPDTSIMQPYAECGGLLYDSEDIAISAKSSFSLDCRLNAEFNAPAAIAHPDNQVLELLRVGPLYKLTPFIPGSQQVPGAVNTLPVRVTHCMSVAAEHIDSAVIGEVRVPNSAANEAEKWHILPTVRFDTLLCAEITAATFLSIFIPETAESPQNVNLVVGWVRIDPHPLYCGLRTNVLIPIANTGQDWFETDSGHVKLTATDYHVPTGVVTTKRELLINTDQLGPGARPVIDFGPFFVTLFENDLHRIEITVDTENWVDEINENDNIWTTEYILTIHPRIKECADPDNPPTPTPRDTPRPTPTPTPTP